MTSLVVDLVGEESRRSSAMVNPDVLSQNQKAQRTFLANNRDSLEGGSNSLGGESLLPSLGSRKSREILRSHHGTIRSGRSQVLCSFVGQNTGHGSSSPGDSSDDTPCSERPLSSLRSGTSFSRIANCFRNENTGESLREIRKRLASLEKEKELVSLTRNLNEMEAEKAARFTLIYLSILLEIPEETLIQRQIIQESKLIVLIVKSYSSSNYAAY